jgi:hypothetical protein
LSSAAEIASELEAFYKGYVDAVNRGDIDVLTELFAFPWALVSGDGGLTVFNNETDHQRFLRKFMLDLKARGWVRGGIDRFSAWVCADDLAMILTDFTRYKSEGSILDAGRACYTVRRDGKAWTMLTITEVKPPFLGPGDLPR